MIRLTVTFYGLEETARRDAEARAPAGAIVYEGGGGTGGSTIITWPGREASV